MQSWSDHIERVLAGKTSGEVVKLRRRR